MQLEGGVFTLASDDRITDLVTGVEMIEGDLWQVQRTSIYPEADSATPKQISTNNTQIAGFTRDSMSRHELTDINGNLSYRQSDLLLNSDGTPQGITITWNKQASRSGFSTSLSYFGRTELTITPGVAGSMNYSHDALGRVENSKDSRHVGDSETVYVTRERGQSRMALH